MGPALVGMTVIDASRTPDWTAALSRIRLLNPLDLQGLEQKLGLGESVGSAASGRLVEQAKVLLHADLDTFRRALDIGGAGIARRVVRGAYVYITVGNDYHGPSTDLFSACYRLTVAEILSCAGFNQSEDIDPSSVGMWRKASDQLEPELLNPMDLPELLMLYREAVQPVYELHPYLRPEDGYTKGLRMRALRESDDYVSPLPEGPQPSKEQTLDSLVRFAQLMVDLSGATRSYPEEIREAVARARARLEAGLARCGRKIPPSEAA